MTKRPDPNTFPGAVREILGILGAAAAAALCGRSERTVYQWADGETPTVPDLRQALALDVAYVRETGRRAPLQAIFGRLLTEQTGDTPPPPAELTREFLDVQAEVGHLAERLRAALDAAGPGGRAVTVTEARGLLLQLESLRLEIDEVDRALRAAAGLTRPIRIRTGDGPC